MAGYIARRLVAVIPVLLGVSVVTFALVNVIPGDPATTLLGAFASEEARRALRESLSLDDPLPVQYAHWLWNVLHLDFGVSYVRGQPVAAVTLEAFLNTLVLLPLSFVFFVLIGVVAGTMGAVRRGTWVDRSVMALALVGTSMPVFWLGLIFIIVFALNLGWFPAGGMRGYLGGGTGMLDVLHHAVLPAVVAAAIPAGALARVVRSAVVEVLDLDFVWMLRAKGVPERRIISRHVLRNALPPVVGMIGLQTGYLLGGQVFAEVVFNWPGIGDLIFQAILKRDLPLIQASVLLVSAMFVLVNLLVDVVNGLADPRVRRATT